MIRPIFISHTQLVIKLNDISYTTPLDRAIMTLNDWKVILKDPMSIITCGSMKDGSDHWQTFPIGMSWQYAMYFLEMEPLQLGNHENTVLCAVRLHTGNGNRQTAVENLRKNGIENSIVEPEVYYKNLPNYKFIISPFGVGLDTHRTYEALVAGCIPIIEDDPLLRAKYEGCPVLYTKDYSEITPAYLEEIYPAMASQTYDFSRIFISFYTEDQRQTIYDCRKHWISEINKNYMETWNNVSYHYFKELCSNY